MTEAAITDRLVTKGWEIFKADKKPIEFTDDHAANNLLNDLAKHPHAFVLACIMDRQIKANLAWLIPYRIEQKLGDSSIPTLKALSPNDLKRLMTKPKALHRFAAKMSDLIHSGIQRIVKEYDGDASGIWRDQPSSALVVYRFLEFDGVGPKIATMATNILAREFKIKMADHYSIDISADVHVRRVFSRLGLCKEGADANQVVYRARALYPEFPGILDLPCWHIGQSWCRPRKPKCKECYMSDVCPSAL